MADFRGTGVPADLLDRYNDGVLGYAAWRQLLHRLLESLQSPQPDPFLAAFDAFLNQLQQINSRPGVCRIFVSHQRANVDYAERIAFLADQRGFEYWLDVHDPLLQRATPLPPVLRSILIAAIIEMALLNSTHLISVQTTEAQRSLWIPYEYGRAKRRLPVSTQVASWFDNEVYSTTKADYLKLGICALREEDVIRWMSNQVGGCQKVPKRWKDEEPAPLPN